MKKLVTLTVAVLSLFALYSCGDDCPEPDECEVPILFQVNPNTLTFGSDDADAQSIFIAAMNVTWTAAVEASAQGWLKISEESDRVSVRVEENESDQNRTGTITITPNNEALIPVVITVKQTISSTIRIPAHMGLWTFQGDPRGSDYADYVITLAGGDGYFDEEQKTILMSDGYAVILEVLTEEVTRQDYQNIRVRPGTFKSSMDPSDPDFMFEKWSFFQTIDDSDVGYINFDGSWMISFSNGFCNDQIQLIDGLVTVEETSDGYHVVADLLTNRDDRVLMEYSGPFDDIRSSASYSTYTQDTEVSGLDMGELQFQGEKRYSAPDTYAWVGILQTPSLNSGAKLDISTYSPKTNERDMPSGDYEFTYGVPYGEFTAIRGYVSGGYAYGSWIYEYDALGKVINYSPLVEGKITVNSLGNDDYTMVVDATMDNYYQIKIYFDGSVYYMDLSSVSASFQGVPYKVENNDSPIAKLPDWNKRSVRYGLANID